MFDIYRSTSGVSMSPTPPRSRPYASSNSMAAPFSATVLVAALVLPVVTAGKIDRAATREPLHQVNPPDYILLQRTKT